MARIVLAIWVTLFSAQTTDLFVLVTPDDCLAADSDERDDDCPAGTCVRCVCCARTPVPVTPVLSVAGVVSHVIAGRPSPTDLVPDPDPRAILHVPKTLS